MVLLASFLNILLLVQQPSEVIDGYTDKLSAFPGDSVTLYFNSKPDIAEYTARLFDLSGKPVADVKMTLFPQSPVKEKAFENGYGYRRTKAIRVPDLPSGIYLWENQIPFIVKARNPMIVVVYPSNTVNAYCNAGGKSLYAFNSSNNVGAQIVSFLRPMPLPYHAEAFYRWVHTQSFEDVGYITDLDLEDYKSIQKSALIIISGHSEYWTLQARKNFDRFVSSGRNAMILSGNTMWWQVRYNKHKDQLICYRKANEDPVKSARLKTITWCEPALSYPIFTSTGTDFQNAGYGLKSDKGWNGYKIVANSPLLEGTALIAGSVLPCPSDETDGVALLTLADGIPIIDNQKLPFKRIEIVGYDLVSRGGKDGVATWIVFKAQESSGVVINTASTDWCSARGIGSSPDIGQITATMIRKLIRNENVFSNDAASNLVN